jgi:hypothetical protein
MTRYEAAALLNKCLGNVSQANEEEQSLINEFGAELAVIRGRLDVLENNLDGVEAGVFSSTTKLSGRTTFVMGAADVTGSEATTFNYDTAISLDSSFTGEDLLTNRIRVGNFSGPFTSEAALETNNGTAADALTIDRSYYQFPVGDDFTATIGAKVRQDDMLGVWPSAYPSDSVLDVMTYAGANAAYNLASGAGAGFTYAKDSLSASLLFVSSDQTDASSGVLTSEGSDDVTAQLAWLGDGFTIATAYTLSDGGCNTEDGDGTCSTAEKAEDFSAWGISGVYEIDNDSQFVPASISAGIGWKSPDDEDDANNVEDETTWTVGLLWNSDFGYEGSTLGFSYGTAEGHRDDAGYDDPMAYEIFYSMPVSDNITVTPAIFSIEKDGQDEVNGALVKTTFTF